MSILMLCCLVLCLVPFLLEAAQWVIFLGAIAWAGVILWKVVTHPLETAILLGVVGFAALILSAYERFIEMPARRGKSRGYGTGQTVPHPLGENSRWSPPTRTDHPTIG